MTQTIPTIASPTDKGGPMFRLNGRRGAGGSTSSRRTYYNMLSPLSKNRKIRISKLVLEQKKGVKKHNNVDPSSDGLGANPSMLHPVPSLTIQRAVLHQPTLAANQSRVLLRLPLCATTVLDTAVTAPLADTLKSTFAIIVKANITVDPVAHVS